MTPSNWFWLCVLLAVRAAPYVALGAVMAALGAPLWAVVALGAVLGLYASR